MILDKSNLADAIAAVSHADPILGEFIASYGRFELVDEDPRSDLFHSLSRAIVYQQLSTKAAATIWGRYVNHFGAETCPEPAQVLAAEHDDLRACGLSNSKVRYLQGLAEAVITRLPKMHEIAEMPNDEVIAHLTTVKGIGVWSAQMLMIFDLRRADVLPVLDLGVQRGMQLLYGLDDLPKPAEMERIAEPWAPYRTVGSWYMWRRVQPKL